MAKKKVLYSVQNDERNRGKKKVVWRRFYASGSVAPTLAELNAVKEKIFPEVSYDQLIVDIEGYDSDTVLRMANKTDVEDRKEILED